MAADGPRYKQLGNSWAVNCVRWYGTRIAAQTPGPDGTTHLRVLSTDRPHPAAEPVDPTLEEGYLALVEGGAA